MNEELSRKRQELANQLVAREVYYCVSMLMYGIAKIMWDCRGFHDAFGDHPDELLSLYQRDDWEEVGREFIASDADLNQLEEIADNFGYWSDVLEQIGYENHVEVKEAYDEIPNELEDWLGEAESGKWAQLRIAVRDLVDDWEWVGHEYNLDPEVVEAYEHWLVSSWLADKLAARGEIIGEFAGLTIWGRTTSGQSIYMDGVIQEIVAEVYKEEWNG